MFTVIKEGHMHAFLAALIVVAASLASTALIQVAYRADTHRPASRLVLVAAFVCGF
jgi:hypothetical protein